MVLTVQLSMLVVQNTKFSDTDCLKQGWIGYARAHVPMFVHKHGLIMIMIMGYLNENIT